MRFSFRIKPEQPKSTFDNASCQDSSSQISIICERWQRIVNDGPAWNQIQKASWPCQMNFLCARCPRASLLYLPMMARMASTMLLNRQWRTHSSLSTQSRNQTRFWRGHAPFEFLCRDLDISLWNCFLCISCDELSAISMSLIVQGHMAICLWQVKFEIAA